MDISQITLENLALITLDPEKVKRWLDLAAGNPEKFILAIGAEPIEIQAKFYAEFPEIAKAVVKLDDTFKAGEEVTVDGFAMWYELEYNRPLPYLDIPVAEAFAWAYHERKGVIYESWRGRGKSTFNASWCPYVMGVRPVGSTALIRINGPKAMEMGKSISELIETSLGWKKMFPHIIPDERAGWSVENGFQVMNTRITGVPGSKNFEKNYSKWRTMCLADHLTEKSLICVGIESGSIIGIHSTNGEWFDDLHDDLNTRSQAEMKKVTDIVEGNLVPTWFSVGGSPTLGVFCTPWSKNPPDAYQVMMKTGLFKHIRVPIFEFVKEGGEEVPIVAINSDGNEENIDPTYAGKRVKLAWPEAFPMEKVTAMILAYKSRFGQMALCDVNLSKPKNMRYQDFPAADIKIDKWEMTTGVDPVGTLDGVSTGEGISHFAMVFYMITPYNSLVIYDGILEKCDALAGEQHMVETQRTYSKTYRRASIEMNGSGAMFIGMITRGSNGLKYASHEVSELGPGKKRERQYRFLQPLFANGSIKVSDAVTPFLNAVREYLDNFPNFDRNSYLWDVGDALAIGALDVPEVWTRIVNNQLENIFAMPREEPDPYDALLMGRR